MKKFNFIIITVVAIFASVAQANQPSILCHGKISGNLYEFAIYEGYGYDATFALTTTIRGHASTVSGYAHGGSFTECGSRANPCRMIQNTQFTVDHVDQLNLIFTMISDAQANVGNGDLAIYDNGFEQSATQSIPVECKK